MDAETGGRKQRRRTHPTGGGRRTTKAVDAPTLDARVVPRLVVIHDGRHGGHVVALEKGRCLRLGRDPKCDLMVAGTEESVSRRHAELELLDDGRVVVRDLGASNGTWVDGCRVDGARILRSGERLQLGDDARYRIEWLTEEEALQMERAIRDDLTGLHRVEAFHAALADAHARAVHGGSPLSLVLADLDDFGRVNKTLGMSAGDAVLREVGACLREAVAPRERAAFRRGGEEFALVLEGTQLEEAVAIAERVRSCLEQRTIVAPAGILAVTGSFGCAALDHAMLCDADLEEGADDRLRMAKRRGKNRVEPQLRSWGDETLVRAPAD